MKLVEFVELEKYLEKNGKESYLDIDQGLIVELGGTHYVRVETKTPDNV